MNDANQISLSGMIWGIATVSLLIAVGTTKSAVVAVGSILLLCLFAGCYCSVKKYRPWYSGAVVGFMVPALLILNEITTTVIKGEMVQGELYYEDGPFIFFLGSAIILVVSGAVFALVGSLTWTILSVLGNRNWDKFEAANWSDSEKRTD